ncbi:hypothetical protein C8R46DRAFT_1321529 [Mycena filopes]|nr:hypothetical protein C8R46DRAFT_1321529 [Mycena filopes]
MPPSANSLLPPIPEAHLTAPHSPPKMSESDHSTTDVPSTPSLTEDTVSDTEVTTSDTDVEPASPGGSLKGLYVRSRPTSMDGSIVGELPIFPANRSFARFGIVLPSATPPAPSPPATIILSRPPPGKKRRYARSVKSLYTGTGTGTSLKTNHSACPTLRTVRRELLEPVVAPVQPVPKANAWQRVRKLIPGIFPRPTTASPSTFDATPLSSSDNTSDDAASCSPTFSRARGALSIRSFRSTLSKSKSKGIENRPAPPPLVHARARVHSFSGYLAETGYYLADEYDDDAADEDETDAEMIAIHREALRTTLRVNALYRFEEVEA